MYTMDELSYLADQVRHQPSGDIYADVMYAMGVVRDAAVEEIAALEAERDALRAERDQLAQQWQPVKDGELTLSLNNIAVDNDWLFVNGEDGDGISRGTAIELPPDLRLCRRQEPQL